MSRMVKKLPKGAKYDYVDVSGFKHYHTSNRRYLVWKNKYETFVKSFSKDEEY